eukprot:gb/GEZJ01004840.1/.p1 GENE.gb/GEZJ01004840.1/~~gb/GEZJ01004840.1/.p1  ORF type:complete len:136 (-),score=17.20 gb/GEZJ01004840.1/:317-724(-)
MSRRMARTVQGTRCTFREELRTFDSLKRNIATLHCRRTPTGDPFIEGVVKDAKPILELLTELADMGEGVHVQETVDSHFQSGYDSGTDNGKPIDSLTDTKEEKEKAVNSPFHLARLCALVYDHLLLRLPVTSCQF